VNLKKPFMVSLIYGQFKKTTTKNEEQIMQGKEFKALVLANIPDDAEVEISVKETVEDGEEMIIWYEVEGVEYGEVGTDKHILIYTGRVTMC
jgi:hypothetical protein